MNGVLKSNTSNTIREGSKQDISSDIQLRAYDTPETAMGVEGKEANIPARLRLESFRPLLAGDNSNPAQTSGFIGSGT